MSVETTISVTGKLVMWVVILILLLMGLPAIWSILTNKLAVYALIGIILWKWIS